MTAWRNQGLAPAAGSVLDEAVALATGRYPGWVYGRRFAARGPDQEVPVFVFHDTPAQAFEEDLAFLAENGYRTIDCEELVDWRAGRASIPERAVLLALDDGRESVWQYAYPLLRKYGMRATTFLIPGYMRRRPRRFPNLEDVWRGACTPDDVARRPTGHYRLLYWEEAREMQESGYVDCQSHSLFHHPVFRDDRLTGFLSGDHSAEAFHDWPVSAEGECLLGAGDLDALVGSPVYRSDSLFHSLRRFVDNDEVRVLMVERARALGGGEFLKNAPDAPAALREHHRDLARGKSLGRVSAPDETREEILRNFRESRERIEAELRKPVRHLCFPYNLHSRVARDLSVRAGYVSNLIGLDRRVRANVADGSPMLTVRLKRDFIRRLPGSKRSSLLRVLLAKAVARYTPRSS